MTERVSLSVFVYGMGTKLGSNTISSLIIVAKREREKREQVNDHFPISFQNRRKEKGADNEPVISEAKQ